MTDILFITPNNAAITYQSLSDKYAAIEPPTWALLLAESARNHGANVAIMDTLAEQLSDADAYNRVKSVTPKLICFVVYGQNVNAGTTNMGGAVRLSKVLKEKGVLAPIGFIGSHVQALPKETLEKENSIDFVFLNEGVQALNDIIDHEAYTVDDLVKVSGLAMRINEAVQFTGKPKVVPHSEIDTVMPGYAWDLLPFRKTPLDLYRSPYWHANYQSELRSPYAAIQTSIGCQFKCSFCMINLINKSDEDPISIASNYSGMRYWSTTTVEKELKKLIEMGVKTIRITDEMFLLNKRFYRPIISMLEKLNLNDELYLWAYSRIDTVPDPETLQSIRKAGIRWLCLGIESGDKAIRLEVAKGKFESVDVKQVVKHVEAAGINVMANYIYGLPGDNEETIQKTFDLSVELNTLGWNTYAAMALPGSPLYVTARRNKVRLPETYEEFSFHSFHTVPLPTESLPAHRILQLRDENFTKYHARPEFLKKISHNFGEVAAQNIIKMNEKTLRRKIIERNRKTRN